MLGEHQTDWRPDLWERCSALQARAYRSAGGTQLTHEELEDVWSDLLVKFARSPGQTASLPVDVDEWNDEQLVGYLGQALNRAAGKAVRKQKLSTGENRFAPTALDDLAEQVLSNDALWTGDSRPLGPEEALLGAEATSRLVHGVHDLANQDAAQLVLAEAAGFSAAEQREMMGLSVPRRRRLGDNLAMIAEDLRTRLQSLLPWMWPEAFMRMVTGWLSGGAVPRIGAVGVAIAAIGGGVVVKEQTSAKAPARAVPTVFSSSSAQAPASAAAQVAVAGSQAADRIAAAAIRQQAAERRARTKARARARAAAAARRESPRPSVAASEFSPATSSSSASVPAASAASAPSTSGSTGGGSSRPSVASNEFEPGGR